MSSEEFLMGDTYAKGWVPLFEIRRRWSKSLVKERLSTADVPWVSNSLGRRCYSQSVVEAIEAEPEVIAQIEATQVQRVENEQRRPEGMSLSSWKKMKERRNKIADGRIQPREATPAPRKRESLIGLMSRKPERGGALHNVR